MIRIDMVGDFVHTYSDAGMMIHGGEPEGDYIDALDPVGSGRSYIETDIPIPDEQGE